MLWVQPLEGYRLLYFVKFTHHSALIIVIKFVGTCFIDGTMLQAVSVTTGLQQRNLYVYSGI